jgi:uncharacterized membrane protein YkvA (DUF1232 family)
VGILAGVIRGLLITLGVLVGVWALAILALILLGRRSAARQLATLLPNLVVLFRGLLRDPDVPRSSKVWIGFAVAWLVSPIDLIPEFIPLLGPLDDAVVAALVLRYVVKRTDRAVLDRHWRGSPAVLDALVRSFPKGTGASPGAVEP